MPETVVPIGLLVRACWPSGCWWAASSMWLFTVCHLMMEARWRRDCCELLEVEPEKQEASLNLATPNSHCPQCKTAIKPWQNIPVLSYLLLGGKCSNCEGAISPRYPIVELVTGLMTLALAWFFDLRPHCWALHCSPGH